MRSGLMNIKVNLAILALVCATCTTLATLSLWITFQSPREKIQSPFTQQVTDQPVWVFDIHGQPKTLPDISFMDTDRQQTSLAAFRGKFLLLNIWATWCPPCIEELPSMIQLTSHFSDQSLAFVALSTDRSPFERVPEFLKKHGLTDLPVYYDPNLSVSRTLGVNHMPTTLIINPLGEEAARLEGPFDWNDETAINLIENFLAMR